MGLFAVLSYSVEQRTPELALRAALGARAARSVALVVGKLVDRVGRLALGLLAPWWSMRFASTTLYGAAPTIPNLRRRVPAVVALVAALATIVPARRAARSNPPSALRKA